MHLDADLNFDRPLTGEERDFLKPFGAVMGRSLWLKHVEEKDPRPALDYLQACRLAWWALRFYIDPPGEFPPGLFAWWLLATRHTFDHGNPASDFAPPPCPLCRRPGILPVDRPVRLATTSGGRIVSRAGTLLVSGNLNLPDSTRVPVQAGGRAATDGPEPAASSAAAREAGRWFRVVFDRRVEALDFDASTLAVQRCGRCAGVTREFTGLPVAAAPFPEGLPRMFAESRRVGRGCCEELTFVEDRFAANFRRYPGTLDLTPLAPADHALARAALSFRAELDGRLPFVTDWALAPFNRQRGAEAGEAAPIYRAVTSRRIVSAAARPSP
ncbi:MAG: hypothetical protein HY719_07040 [Planctomycetes bacterium]|nr:hypothetical protein [Planctomycetota bacterium]